MTLALQYGTSVNIDVVIVYLFTIHKSANIVTTM